MAQKATPVAVAAAVVIGALVVVRLVRSRARRHGSWRSPAKTNERPSLFSVALGAALRGAVRVVATRMAEQAVARLVAANEEGEVTEREPDIELPGASSIAGAR